MPATMSAAPWPPDIRPRCTATLVIATTSVSWVPECSASAACPGSARSER